MKTFLLSGQEQALSLTARAIATVLHDRPEMFSKEHTSNSPAEQENDIYAVPLPNYININGDLSDWGDQANQTERFDIPQVTSQEALSTSPPSLDNHTENNIFSVNHTFGYRGNFIYALFKVSDESVLFRQKRFLRVDVADHIRLTLQQPNRPLQRYTLIADDVGRMSIYLVHENWQDTITGEPIYDMAAEIALTDDGYNVELRIPRFILSSDTRIGLSVIDVDDPESVEIEASIPITPQSDGDNLSRLLVQSTEITKILKGLDRADTRIWVIDKSKQIRAVVGNISDDENNDNINKPASSKNGLAYIWASARYYFRSTMRTIFNFIIDQSVNNFDDYADSVDLRNDEIIAQALQGKISTDRRPSLDSLGTILMAAHPIYLGDNIPGMVIVEQSTKSRLTLRIRRLRNATDNAIDRDGRIINQKLSADATSGDEIGDLSRSVSNMLGRLSQYTNYLKGLPDTLAHEISNPLNVVNSSLHNLSQELPSSANSKYMERAKNGINRIGLILRNLTEAANLEQAMQSETREDIDLVELVEGYIDGYSFSNPKQKFEVLIQKRPLEVEIAPDYIAQALDKLVDNAIDHAADDTSIIFKVSQKGSFASISVINNGSSLPEGMAERIFEPLVSLGRKDAQKISLGMGLYVVKLIASFHGGDVHARNLFNSDGVIFTLSLPLKNTIRAE